MFQRCSSALAKISPKHIGFWVCFLVLAAGPAAFAFEDGDKLISQNEAVASNDPQQPVPPQVQPQQPAQPQPAPQPPQVTPQPKPQPQQPGPAALVPPVWGDSARVIPWTNAVRAVVKARLKDLEAARDVELFCPGYSAAQLDERVNCWALLVSGVSKFESNFKTGDSFVEPNGTSSIGLLALSPGECPNARSASQLKDGVQNLICGTNKLASLVARDRMIEGSQIGPDGRVRPPLKNGRAPYPGATAYWSTLKPKHTKYNPRNGRTYHLGFKPEIMGFTHHFRDRKKGAFIAEGEAFEAE